jgi:ureidoacrylate peracid hydrolase
LLPAGALDLDRCALVVIDMQNDYFHEDGALARMGHDTAHSRDQVPSVLELIELARDADVPRIFVRQTHSHWFNTAGWLSRGRDGAALDVVRNPIVEDGTWGAEFFAVEPREDELIVTKHRYDAFQYTPLELALRAKQRDTLLLCGVATDVCVRYTAVSAVTNGFFPILVEDCSLSATAEQQQRSVQAYSEYIGTVASLADVRAAWGVPVAAR